MTHPIQQQQNAEPWIPEGLLEKLVVGARVRVRFSAECQIKGVPGSAHDRQGNAPGHGDEMAVQGKIGRIQHTTGPIEDHPYEVHVEGRFEFQGERFCCVWVAASELELVSDEGRER